MNNPHTKYDLGDQMDSLSIDLRLRELMALNLIELNQNGRPYKYKLKGNDIFYSLLARKWKYQHQLLSLEELITIIKDEDILNFILFNLDELKTI